MTDSVSADQGQDQGEVVMYEDLAEIEKRFEDVEVDLLRQNYILSEPIYTERAKLVRSIPHFWPIVIEEAPEEIDRRIQPCDTAALSSLRAIEVTRFEISPDLLGIGEPRSVKISLSFAENAWFEDPVLEKKFWYRRSRNGWTGLVSDPVQIHWRKGKDLTEGLLDHAVQVFKIATEIKNTQSQTEDGMGTGGGKQKRLDELSAVYQTVAVKLAETLKTTPQDAVSFFAWFGYRGKDVSAEESAEAMKLEREKRERSNNPKGVISKHNTIIGSRDGPDLISSKAIALDELDENELSHEIFPAGEDLAVAISDDLYPGAIKYFTQAQEKDLFDSDDEEDDRPGSGSNLQDSSGSDEPAMKRLKTAA